MSYANIANMTESGSLMRRCFAAAAQEGETDPEGFVGTHRWEYAASPGWADAWGSATAGGDVDPGANEAVITDGMILSATQAIRA